MGEQLLGNSATFATPGLTVLAAITGVQSRGGNSTPACVARRSQRPKRSIRLRAVIVVIWYAMCCVDYVGYQFEGGGVDWQRDRFRRAGNMHGVAAATGDHATATASYATQPVPDGAIDLAAELRAVREQLAKIPDMDPKALTRLDEAQTEASAPEPGP